MQSLQTIHIAGAVPCAINQRVSFSTLSQLSSIDPGKLFFHPHNSTLLPLLKHRTLFTSGFFRHLTALYLKTVYFLSFFYSTCRL
jgi:hypothetical protein